MKLTITRLAQLGYLIAHLASCNSAVTQDQLLTIEMYGVTKAASTALGDKNPNFQSYQLLAVDFLSADGSSKTNLFNNEDDRTFVIVERQQIIFAKKISELVGVTYSAIQVTFHPTVKGGRDESPDNSFNMTNPILSLTTPLVVATGKSLDMVIKINWGNTLSDAGMSEPDYLFTGP